MKQYFYTFRACFSNVSGKYALRSWMRGSWSGRQTRQTQRLVWAYSNPNPSDKLGVRKNSSRSWTQLLSHLPLFAALSLLIVLTLILKIVSIFIKRFFLENALRESWDNDLLLSFRIRRCGCCGHEREIPTVITFQSKLLTSGTLSLKFNFPKERKYTIYNSEHCGGDLRITKHVFLVYNNMLKIFHDFETRSHIMFSHVYVYEPWYIRSVMSVLLPIFFFIANFSFRCSLSIYSCLHSYPWNTFAIILAVTITDTITDTIADIIAKYIK